MRRTALCLVACSTLAACWRDQPRSTLPRPAASSQTQTTTETKTEEPAPERDYRVTTVAIDTLGVGAMVAGLIQVHNNPQNQDLGGALIDGGMAVAAFGTVVTHLAMGRSDRAWRSYLIRSGFTLFGSITGSLVACGDRGEDLGCMIEGLVGGTAAGLAVAGAVDALVLQAPERSVMPTLSVQEGGARVGLGGSF